MDRLLPDLAHSFRRLARAPGFATIAILSLALGIGANTAIFTVVETVLLRPLPYGDPDRLVMIWGNRDKGETTWISGPELLDYQAETSTFDQAVAALTPFVDFNAANAAGFDTSQAYAFQPFNPTLPNPLGDFTSFSGC